MNNRRIALLFNGACIILFLFAIPPGCGNSEETKKRQQYARGKMLYKDHCQRCHKKDGEGFEQLYPPLNKVNYLFENEKRVPCIIRHGMEGPLRVKGKTYNLRMPGNNQLTEYDIAQLMTYIYNAWDNEHERFTVQEVRNALEACDTVVRSNN